MLKLINTRNSHHNIIGDIMHCTKNENKNYILYMVVRSSIFYSTEEWKIESVGTGTQSR